MALLDSSRGFTVKSRGFTVKSRGLTVNSRGLNVNSRGFTVKSRGLTVKVAGIFLVVQLRDKLRFLSQQRGPVHSVEKAVLLHLVRP